MVVKAARPGSLAEIAERTGIEYQRLYRHARGGSRLTDAELARLALFGVTFKRHVDDEGLIWTLQEQEGKTRIIPPEGIDSFRFGVRDG